MDLPRHAIDAVTHPDPWPYYAALRQGAPLSYDASLRLWVAAHEDVVSQVLAHPDLRVRPPAEPVPRALVGTAAGEVFALLVRMNDGEFHAKHRPHVQARAAGISREAVARCAGHAALDLWPRVDANALLTDLPVQAVARALGVPQGELEGTVRAVADFTQGIAAGADEGRIEAAGRAAQLLMSQGRAEGLDEVAAANRIALMQQSLDATAALLGTALLEGVPADTSDLTVWVASLARRRPPVHNTRRFAAAPLSLAGRSIAQGECVLLVLASCEMPFSAGAHACPGEALAIQIVASALAALREAPGFAQRTWRVSGFRPLPNARIPVFHP